jgi:hypothetical protein
MTNKENKLDSRKTKKGDRRTNNEQSQDSEQLQTKK